MPVPADVYIGLMRDGSAIATATNAATIAVRDGDFAAARATLSAVLAAAPVAGTVGVPLDAVGSFDADVVLDFAEAASLYARVLATTGCARAGLAYSASAYQTAREAAKPGSDLRLRTAAIHAYLLRTTGDPAAAVPVGRDLARQLLARFGATDRRTLAAHGDFAVTLHAAGECLTGRQILHRTGELVRSTYGPDDPLGVRMRDRLADLTHECRSSGAGEAGTLTTVAGHVCGQPNVAASFSIVDLFGDLFAGDNDEIVRRPPDATAADSAGDPSLAAAIGGIETPESGLPPWADRPTAGFPTVPIAVGLHPIWVTALPEPVSAPRPIGATTTVGAAGNGIADLPVTHSRATFGRMRRLATDAGPSSHRPQRTATTGSAKTTEGE